VQSYRINKFLHRLVEPAFRARFRIDEAGLMREHHLTAPIF